MKGKNQDIQYIIDFVTADDSNLSGLSDSDDSDQEPEAIINSQEQENSNEEIDEDSSEESEDDKPLSDLAGNPTPRIFRWHRQDTPHRAYEFTGEYSPPPDTSLKPLQYFTKFLTNETLNDVVENTNLYSVEKRGKYVSTDYKEMKTFLGMQILMGIVQMPHHDAYWSKELRYPLLAHAIPLLTIRAASTLSPCC